MATNGLHVPLVQMGMGIGAGPKVAIQPTPGAIRKQPQMKPKQRKSRTGCMTCKAKRLKCDEKKPYCDQCTRKGIQCEGYAKNFKWKSFEDMQEQKKNAPVRRKSTSAGKRAEDDEFPESVADQEFKTEYALSPSEMMPPPGPSVQFNSPFSNHPFSPSYDNIFGNGITNGFLSGTGTSPRPNLPYSSPRSDNASPMSIASLLNEDHDNAFSFQFGSPPKKDTLNRSEMASTISTQPKSVPQVTRTPPPIPFLHPIYREYEFHDSDESENDDENDIEEIPRPEDSLDLIRSPKRRRLNSYVPSDTASLHLPTDELRMWDFYSKVTSTILSCKNAAGENPWRDDLVARAMESDALKHALFAMTSFHLKRHMPGEERSMANYGLSHTNSSFRALRKVMNDGLAFDENNIAAMLVLSFSQVWDDPRLDGRTHVLGASKILDKHLKKLVRKNENASPFMRFLFNTWLYLDVLSSLSSGEDPCYLSVLASSPTMSTPTSPVTDRPRNFSLQNEIDSLLGCAEDLFPLIARMSRVANALADRAIDKTDIPMIYEAVQVRDDLLNWIPPETTILHPSRDEHCSLDDIVKTAEVYRLTALLHLYRAFPPLGRDTSKLADQILDGLLSIPIESGTLCIHIWPLMAAGCEHTDPFKRALTRQRFDEVSVKLKVANVDQAIELLEKVWERRDAGDMNAGWVTLARERGWHLLLG